MGMVASTARAPASRDGSPVVAANQRPPRRRTRSRREARVGYALVAPALAFVAVFILWPLGYGAFVSFTNYPLVGPYHYVGGLITTP